MNKLTTLFTLLVFKAFHASYQQRNSTIKLNVLHHII